MNRKKPMARIIDRDTTRYKTRSHTILFVHDSPYKQRVVGSSKYCRKIKHRGKDDD